LQNTCFGAVLMAMAWRRIGAGGNVARSDRHRSGLCRLQRGKARHGVANAAELATTLQHYLKLYNHHIPQRAIGSKTAGELFAEAALFSAAFHRDAIAVSDSAVLVYPSRNRAS
jgi:hypothetical protein